MKPSLFASFFLAFSTLGTHAHAEPAHQAREELATYLQAELDERQGEDTATPGYAVFVIEDGQVGGASAGLAAPDGPAMSVNTPFRMASVTKTFVAAALLRLYEQGALDLDAPVENLISQPHRALLAKDGYDLQSITVRHLMMHSSGLNDHAQTDAFLETIIAKPDQVWSRRDQIALLVSATDPVGEPGEQFRYSDTGYILLGEILERQTGKTLAKAVAELNRFDALGITTLRWEGETPHEALPARAHQWFQGLDTYDFDGSLDAFGGGGLISNVADTARYFEALFSGRVFRDPATLELMKSAPGHPPGSPYRLGLFVDEVNGYTVYQHGGFWGSVALHAPELNLTVAGVALDEANEPKIRGLARELIKSR